MKAMSGYTPIMVSTGLDTTSSSRNVHRQLATSPSRCTRLHTKLRNMSEDVTTEPSHIARFVVSTLRPMQRISMDTIGPLQGVMTFKFIIVFIDTFTRYVELFPENTVWAISAGNELYIHIYIYRFYIYADSVHL